MKETIKETEEKYQNQNELLDTWLLRGLDKRTLHESIKAMLINTTNDCIKYECKMDPEISTITKIYVKETKTEDDKRQLKHSQERLKVALHLARVSEESLGNLLSEMLLSDEIKDAFKQDIPELYNGLYYMVDLEDEIIDNLVAELSESYELNYKEICSLINSCISEVVDNAEEYSEEVTNHDLYDDFTDLREIWRNSRKGECQ